MWGYKYTFVAVVMSCVLYVNLLYWNVDLFEYLLHYLHKLEHYELDELILPIFIIAIALSLDFHVRRNVVRIQSEKEKMYRTVLSASNHILNNFITRMQLFKCEAHRVDGFNRKMLAHYDDVVDEASLKIRELAAIKRVSEENIEDLVYPRANDKR